MSRRYAPATEGELDRLLLIAPPDSPAPPPVDAPIARLHWGEADPGDEDPGPPRPSRGKN